MTENEAIVFTADERKLLAAIAKINAQLDKTKTKAKGAGDALDGIGGSVFNNASKAVTSFGRALSGLGNIALGVGKTIGAIGVSLAASMALFNSGAKDLERGLTGMLRMQAAEPLLNRFGAAIRRGSNGLIGLNNQIKIARTAQGVISPQDLERLVAYGTELSKTNSELDAAEITTRLLELAVKGEAKGLDKVSLALAKKIKQQEVHLKNSKGQIDSTRMLNLLLRQAEEATKKSAGTSSIERLLGYLRQMEEQFASLKDVAKGFGKIMFAVLAPLGAGIAGFAFGGPIGGLIGTVVGGAVSGALGAFGIGLLRKINAPTKEGKTPFLDKMLAMGTVLDKLSMFGLELLGNDKATLSIDQKTRRDAGLTIGKHGTMASLMGGVANIALIGKKFSEGFNMALEDESGNMKASLTELGAGLASIAKSPLATQVGFLLGKISATLIETLPGILEFIKLMSRGVLRLSAKFGIISETELIESMSSGWQKLYMAAERSAKLKEERKNFMKVHPINETVDEGVRQRINLLDQEIDRLLKIMKENKDFVGPQGSVTQSMRNRALASMSGQVSPGGSEIAGQRPVRPEDAPLRLSMPTLSLQPNNTIVFDEVKELLKKNNQSMQSIERQLGELNQHRKVRRP